MTLLYETHELLLEMWHLDGPNYDVVVTTISNAFEDATINPDVPEDSFALSFELSKRQ